MQFRREIVYRAHFRTLKLNAFGIDQQLAFEATIEIYQARLSPERWKASPQLARNMHKWEASSRDELMRLIERDFVTQVSDWREIESDFYARRAPTLVHKKREEDLKAS